MTGSIRRRGKKSWELKFDLGTDPATQRRVTRYHSFKGTKSEAQKELTRLTAGADVGNYVDPSKLTLSEYFDRWEKDWAANNLSPKSLERYKEIAQVHIRPHLGAMRLQKLKPAQLAELYAKLSREGRRSVAGGKVAGLSSASVRYVHRVLHRALGHAVLWGLIHSNPCSSVESPRPESREIEILTEAQVRDLLTKQLSGRPMHLIAMLGLATGMRRGEMLALRWRDVDLEGSVLRVEQSLEQTKAGLRFKNPKTRHGRRRITLSPSVVTELRAHRRAQQEQRLALGLGREPDDSLVFRQPDGSGSALLPNSVSTEWRRLVRTLKLPKVSLHAWRHTHASQLIASGLDVLTISRRLGHGSPSITLNVYGHLFHTTDDRASAVFEASLVGTIRE